MENFFIIPSRQLQAHGDIPTNEYDFCGFEYCEDLLDIPAESIKDAVLTDTGLEISLVDDTGFCREDWYVQLGRLSSYMRYMRAS